MNEKTMLIRNRLIEHGKALFNNPQRQLFLSTGEPEADALLHDIDAYPHAFVLACLMDRQFKTEKAWLIPYLISEKIGGFSMDVLSRLSAEETNRLFTQPRPIHRFVNKMSDVFHSAVQRIHNKYADNAARIWSGRLSSADAVERFLKFDGAGPKIAHMAVNILAREFKIEFADYSSIDISADVHVRRVFARLGLCAAGATVEQVIVKAKAMHPEYPGLMDLPCWEIGRN